jgi:hypothetical protein
MKAFIFLYMTHFISIDQLEKRHCEAQEPPPYGLSKIFLKY